jgi:hypothetical protein
MRRSAEPISRSVSVPVDLPRNGVGEPVAEIATASYTDCGSFLSACENRDDLSLAHRTLSRIEEE